MYVHHLRFELQARIDGTQPIDRRDGLGLAEVSLGEESLSLQIGQLDDVTVDERQPPHPAAGKLLCGNGSQRATAQDHHVRRGDSVLPGRADPRQNRLPMVTILRRARGCGLVCRQCRIS